MNSLGKLDPRQSAYDAVYREIRRHDYDAAINSFAWRCAHAALESYEDSRPEKEQEAT